MSLDVYLYERVCPFEDDLCLLCVASSVDDNREHLRLVFQQNITHNLGKMADAAGFYQATWRPEELFNSPRARDIAPFLVQGLAKLRSDPPKYIKLQPTNGWGTHASFMVWVSTYLEECLKNPDAFVRAVKK